MNHERSPEFLIFEINHHCLSRQSYIRSLQAVEQQRVNGVIPRERGVRILNEWSDPQREGAHQVING
jgi:hypothetical protein